MPDVDILDIKVPIQFYQALAPFRAVSDADMEARLTIDMVLALKRFLQDLATVVLTDTVLKKRSGRLARAVAAAPSATGSGRVNTIQGHFVVPDFVAIHEFGGTIVPRSARMLAVPMPDAMRADGTPKRRSPREWKSMGTFTYTSKKTGKHYVAYRDKEQDRLVLLYVLVDQVKMKEQLGVRLKYRLLLPILLSTWEIILAAAIEEASLTFLVSIGDKMVI